MLRSVPEKPKYDPDRLNEDLDFTDPDVIDAWLSNPVVEALHEDMGREFRLRPAEEQLPELLKHLRDNEDVYERTRDLRAKLAGDPDTDPETIAALDRMLAGTDDIIASAKRRIEELSPE